MRQLLEQHLAAWLGQWPPDGELTVVTAPGRTEPGWDGRVHPVIGVTSPIGTALSVPPGALAEARRLAGASGLDGLGQTLGPLVGLPGKRLVAGVFRWCEEPAPLPDAGVWLSSDDPRVPAWLHPFGGHVLVALDNIGGGTYMAGVGAKRHDQSGHELAVGTDEAYRGRGLARRLVAQAARRVLDQGVVPTYLHDPGNLASARVADAAGFKDVGWRVLGLW